MCNINDDYNSDYEEIKFFLVIDRESNKVIGKQYKDYKEAGKDAAKLTAAGRDVVVIGEY